MKKGHLKISDHALLRYLERVCGHDVDGAKRALASLLDSCVPDNMADGISGIGYEGFIYRIKGDVVTTVIPRNQPRRRGRRR